MEQNNLFDIEQPLKPHTGKKEWKGNKHSVFVTLGANNHTDHARATLDYYATEPAAAEWLLKIEPTVHDIWENACGAGHVAQVFDKAGKLAKATDIVHRGYEKQTETLDFLKCSLTGYKGSIVTNPPYTNALEFVQRSLGVVADNELVCMFLKVQFLEGKERRAFFEENPPVRIWVSSGRLKCAINGTFDKLSSSATCYCWYVWQKGYNGPTTIKWFN